MSVDRIKLIVAMCLSLGVLLFTLGCNMLDTVNNSRSLEPIRRFRLTIDKSQREELFAQFQKFAEKHKFEIDITDFNTNGEYFQVWMSGDGIQIVASDILKELN